MVELERQMKENQQLQDQVPMKIKEELKKQKDERDSSCKMIKKCLKIIIFLGFFIILMMSVITLLGVRVKIDFDGDQTWPQQKMFGEDEIIKFNVGGETGLSMIYSTLLSVKGSKLRVEFMKPQSVSKDGTVFLDRSYQPFKRTIDFIRNGLAMPQIDNIYDRKMFMLELKYWGIP